jgi:hypothetical protein
MKYPNRDDWNKMDAVKAKTLTVIKDFHYTIQGSLQTFPLKAGTVLTWTRILNNGTTFMAYECQHEGKTVYVKPIIGYVVAS